MNTLSAAAQVARSGGRRAAGRTVTALAIRQVRRGAVVVAALAAGMSALVVVTYSSTIGDALDNDALTALAENPAIRTLFGEPVALTDPGGFTVWRTGTVVAVLVSVWGLLTATRVTRGEEDAGHWYLLLGGRVPIHSLVTRNLLVIDAAALATGALIAAALIVAGTTVTGAVLHGAGIALVAVVFASTGAVAAQVFASQRVANIAGAGLLVAMLLARMLGDGIDALGWLRWMSPFGLVALVRPFEADQVLPLAMLAAAAAALVAAAAATARGRDVGAGWIAQRTRRPPRRLLLGSVAAFAARRQLRLLTAWCAGVAAYFLLIGVLAVSLTQFLTDNARFAELAGEAGFGALGTVNGYAAALFGLLALPVGIFAALRVAALAADETAHRLTALFAAPLPRWRLLAAEAGASAAGAVVLAAVGGVATWAGAATVSAGLGLGAAMAGALNVLPVAALCLGAAVSALGWLPRAVGLVGAAPAVGGFLLQVVAESTGAPQWVADLSPFAHLAPVPTTSPNWIGAAVMLAVAAGLYAAGSAGYQRRDLLG